MRICGNENEPNTLRTLTGFFSERRLKAIDRSATVKCCCLTLVTYEHDDLCIIILINIIKPQP